MFGGGINYLPYFSHYWSINIKMIAVMPYCFIVLTFVDLWAGLRVIVDREC